MEEACILIYGVYYFLLYFETLPLTKGKLIYYCHLYLNPQLGEIGVSLIIRTA